MSAEEQRPAAVPAAKRPARLQRARKEPDSPPLRGTQQSPAASRPPHAAASSPPASEQSASGRAAEAPVKGASQAEKDLRKFEAANSIGLRIDLTGIAKERRTPIWQALADLLDAVVKAAD